MEKRETQVNLEVMVSRDQRAMTPLRKPVVGTRVHMGNLELRATQETKANKEIVDLWEIRV